MELVNAATHNTLFDIHMYAGRYGISIVSKTPEIRWYLFNYVGILKITDVFWNIYVLRQVSKMVKLMDCR